MEQAKRTPQFPWFLMTGATLVIFLLALATVAAAPMTFYNGEELVNATVSRELLVGNLPMFLQYQHNPHCGGCSVMALAGWASFRLAGVSYLSWKAVPAAWAGLTLIAGFVLLRSRARPWAGRAWIILLIASPTVVFQGMLMAWGNHFEMMALVMLQTLLTMRIVAGPREERGSGPLTWFAWGLLAGLAAWFCFGSLFAFPTLFALTLLLVPLRRAIRCLIPLMIGLAIGLLPLWVYVWDVESSPFVMLRIATAATRDSTILLAKLHEASLGRFAAYILFEPNRLWTAGTGVLVLASLWLAAAANLVIGFRKARGHAEVLALPLLHLAAILAYAFSSLRVADLSGPFPPDPAFLRYLVPASLLLIACAAAGIGQMIESGRLGRILAIPLLIAIVGPGLWNRIAWIRPLTQDRPGPDAQDILPLSYFMIVRDMAHDRPAGIEARIDPDDWTSRVNHRRWQAMKYALPLLERGPGQVADTLGGMRLVPAYKPAESLLWMNGVGRELSFVLRRGADEDQAWKTIVEVLEFAAPDERHTIATEFLLSVPSHLLVTLGRPLPRSVDELATAIAWPVGAANCALCPGVGRQLTRLMPPDDVRSVADLFQSGDACLPEDPMTRGSLLEGAGIEYGVAFGYIDEILVSVDKSLGAADRERFRIGYEIGRARSWNVRIPPGAVPESVP